VKFQRNPLGPQAMSSSSILQSLVSRWVALKAKGESIPLAELCREHPELLQELRECVSALNFGGQIEEVAKQETVESEFATVHATPDAFGPLRPAESPEELGRLAGFRVLKLLGRGGMGAVYLAEEIVLCRKVALKIMLPEAANRADARARFLREAQSAARLHSDHIVPIFQVGEDNGVAFLTMPFLQGESLQDRLSRQLPSLRELIAIGLETASGLSVAHAHGLLHRDIKPGNLWLETLPASDLGFRVRILDFGLARPVEEKGLTQTGAVLGTPGFMAPEQVRGAVLDARADLFSLGCVLYYAASGTRPFVGGNTWEVLMATQERRPASLKDVCPNLPSDLLKLIMELLRKEAGQRPSSADAVCARLRAIKNTSIQSVPPAQTCEYVSPNAESLRRSAAAVPLVPSLPRSAGHGRRVALWVAALSVVAASLVWWFSSFILQTPNGTLIVEIHDDNIEVVIKQNGVVVVDKTMKREFSIKPGEGVLEAYEVNGIKLATKEFTLNRGGREIIRIALPKQGVANQPVPVPKPAVPRPATGKLHLAIEGPADTSVSVKRGDKVLVAKTTARDHTLESGEGLAEAYDRTGKVVDSQRFVLPSDGSITVRLKVPSPVQSTLVIQIQDDRNFDVVVKQSGAIVVDKSKKREFTLSDNQGEIEVYEKDGALLYTQNFTILAGGREVVQVNVPRMSRPNPANDRPWTPVKWGDSWQAQNSIRMTLVWIPPGKFLMGSRDEDGEPDERPQREVEITKGFWMGKHEVTQPEFLSIMGRDSNSYRPEPGDKPMPVDNVTWKEAKDFCSKLGEKEGKLYRLPTEAEWEYACRAGTSTPYTTGPTLTKEQANIDKKVSRTEPVGSYLANPWGLLDMHGNVLEFCEDWYHKDSYRVDMKRDPTGPPTGSHRVIRGGSWNSPAYFARSATRNYYLPDGRSHQIGFRVVVEGANPKSQESEKPK
jgi:formylglycine-generating enzyme required for sulfatase activity/serine/threonine protein kinase